MVDCIQVEYRLNAVVRDFVTKQKLPVLFPVSCGVDKWQAHNPAYITFLPNKKLLWPNCAHTTMYVVHILGIIYFHMYHTSSILCIPYSVSLASITL